MSEGQTGLARQSVFSVAASLFQLVTSVATGIILARALGPGGKGQAFLAFQYAAFGAMLLSLGLGPAYLYHIRRRTMALSEAVAHASVVVVGSAVVAAILYTFARPLLRLVGHETLSDALLVFALALVVLNLIVNYLGFLVMSLDKGVESSSKMAAASSAAYVCAVVLLIQVGHLGVPGALCALMVPLLLKIVLSSSLLRRALVPMRLGNPMGHTKSLLQYGVGAFSASFMLNSVLRLDTFLVNAFAGPAALGVYSVAVNIAEMALIVPSAVGVAAFPHLTSMAQHDRLASAAQIARVGVIFSLITSALVIAVGSPVIRLAFGDAFSGAYAVAVSLTPGLVALTTVYGYGNYFSSAGRPWVNTLIFGLGAAVNVALNAVLIPWIGIVGAGLSSSLSYVFVIACMVVVLVREGPLTATALLVPTRRDVQMCQNRVRALLATRKGS